MKTQLMRKDPLPLMEYAFGRVLATAAAAAEHMEPQNLKSAVGSVSGRRQGFLVSNPVWFSRSLTF